MHGSLKYKLNMKAVLDRSLISNLWWRMNDLALGLRLVYAGPWLLVLVGTLFIPPLRYEDDDWINLGTSAAFTGLASISHRFLLRNLPLFVTTLLISVVPVGLGVYRLLTMELAAWEFVAFVLVDVWLLLLPASLVLSLLADTMAKRRDTPKHKAS
jgi:hypothetical protein